MKRTGINEQNVVFFLFFWSVTLNTSVPSHFLLADKGQQDRHMLLLNTLIFGLRGCSEHGNNVAAANSAHSPGLEGNFFFRCYIKSAVVFLVQSRRRTKLQTGRDQSRLFFFLQPVVKNELFNSKQAFSWPFVRFDLGSRSLHECLYCHVMFSQRVNY